MAINFPNSPTNGQLFGSGPIWVYNNGAWRRKTGTALPNNYLINPAMQISQQIGTTATATAINVYGLDQWRLMGSGTVKPIFSIQQLALVTPLGSPYRMRCTYTTVGSGTSASAQFVQSIEGNRVADLQFGTANAKQVVLRAGIRSSVAATYNLILRNISTGRAYAVVVPIAAGQINTDVYFTFVIPGDTIGTWPKDNTVGMEFVLNVHTGAVLSGSWTPNFWQGSTDGGPSTGTGTVNAAIDLFDCGLYADPNLTGVAPEFQAPHYEDDLQECLRYWYPAYRFDGVVTSTTQAYGWCNHYVAMRASPAYALVGTLRGYDVSVAPNITAVSPYNVHAETGSLLFTSGTTMTVGRPYKTLVDGQVANYIGVSARM